ncbi:MAG TPA: AMP-binding protein [Deltaproteobacteria bacterium]|nr:AMP-binding protein [Deltaproteobacteria bacterium]HOM30243.1 AMP-binding protein [Deltaproteobacteria bacterium]HPP81740.1 AMP-binding protein [Deltaproteobacteria bacterium]
MLVQHFLEHSARRLPDKTALVFGNERLTYGALNALANRFAHALMEAGLLRGERVAVFLDNSIETVISIFGTLKAGGVFSVLSPTMKERKLSYILNHLDASFLVTHASKMNQAAPASADAASLRAVITSGGGGVSPHTPVSILDWDGFIRGKPDHEPSCPSIDIDLATIIYTSGTTADPKGIMMTHLNMTHVSSSIISYLQNDEADVIMDVLPLSFDYGLYQALMSLRIGGTLVLERSFSFPYAIVERMAGERVTGFPGVPTVFAMLLRLESFNGRILPHLRYITNTGAPLPVRHIQLLRERFPNVALYSMYGLTECKRVSYLPPSEIDRRPESVGIPIPNTEVFIVDEHGNRVEQGMVGELVVRGAHVMKGYWKDPEETAKRLRPGLLPDEKVLFTGDLFRMDEDGFLYFIARKDDLIKTRGERVSPREVENAIHEIPGVVEAAVIAVPDEILGSAIKAFVVVESPAGLTERDVIAHCAKTLETFMVPKYVEFVSDLPRTSSGKVDKKALR